MKNFETIGNSRENEECPDKDLQSECEGLCRVDYNKCRLLCETEYCQSICEREYQFCLDNCPCGINCKEGCINCDNEICPVRFLLVMGYSLIDAFSISFDGLTKTGAKITAPSDDYIKYAPHALVKGELYIFGGATDFQKVLKNPLIFK
ncbi:Oidioi.mRNA.OKI2018_I69.PAR.g9036.t1.cds [Oikopleura dioica]|uniref:Oidioi.mRNA.OKI2018_I69.PAR.g9036.t1.cds n=1 Tax=Oikopleura dioica TaxID=34765 RepID=A0ABN7RIP8_OIKDI|nr:Oidioi.mRNA.OKI2018_I69.PAR.g9036.t1.cds [Oikopleura dioica]